MRKRRQSGFVPQQFVRHILVGESFGYRGQVPVSVGDFRDADAARRRTPRRTGKPIRKETARLMMATTPAAYRRLYHAALAAEERHSFAGAEATAAWIEAQWSVPDFIDTGLGCQFG